MKPVRMLLFLVGQSIVGTGLVAGFTWQQKILGEHHPADELKDQHMVPGNNNATYGPVPKAKQLFDVEYLEIASSPIPVDRIFFTLLRGSIPLNKMNLSDLNHLLDTATISITMSVILPDGQVEGPRTYTMPFAPLAVANTAHFSIRDADGAYVQRLSPGINEILTDYWIPGMFLKTGTWTFEVVARLGNGDCLYAMTLTQWLKGKF